MKRIFAGGVVTFCITLAVFLGYKLSADALAIMAGVVLGILGSVPFAILFAWAFSRRQHEGTGTPQQPLYPPVVVVGGGGALAGWGRSQTGPALPPPTVERRFNIIGSEDDEWMANTMDGAGETWGDR